MIRKLWHDLIQDACKVSIATPCAWFGELQGLLSTDELRVLREP